MAAESRPEARRAALLSELVYAKNQWSRLMAAKDAATGEGNNLNFDFRSPIFARMKVLSVYAQIREIDREWGWDEEATNLSARVD